MSDFKLFEGKEAEPQEISAFSLEGENPLPSGPLLVEKSFFIGILFPDETIHLEFSHSNYPGEMNFNTLEGDPEFSVVSNSCISARESCSVGIIFQTSTEGFRFAFATSSIIENEVNTFNFLTSWSAIVLEPIEEPEDEKKVCGSILSVDDKSVAERVSVVGAPFDLDYSSAHSEEYDSNYENPFLLNTFNPESWSLSILHSYNALEKNLFPGSGGRVPREASTDASGNLLVVNGDEVYTFDAGGKHLSTRSALTGRLIYTFSYTADNKIQKITDAFGKETVFTRNAEGGLQSIIAPFGQITTIELDDLGRIISITDPQGQTHSISYQADADLIASFTKPSGMRSEFSFENGYLVSDVANGGNSWTLVPGAEGTAHKTELISKLNRKTVFVKDNDYETGLYTRTETSPAGFVTSYTEASDRSFTRSNQFESIRQSTVPDERFGASRQRPSVLEETVDGVTRLTQYLQSVVLSNPSDPFSYTQMTSTTKVNDAVSVTVFDKPTMTSTTTNPSGVVTEMKMDEFERPISLKLGNDTALSMSYDSAGRIQQMNQGGSNSVSYTYNAEGYLASETNALNQVTRYNYDAAGRVIQTILADGRILGFEYNPDGRIIGVIPAGRPVHNFSFNLMGLMQTYEPPLLPGVASTQTSYTYNEDKQLTSILRPDGKSINFSYNAISGLLEARDNQSYSYFPNTELVQSITSEDGVVSSFTYFGTETMKSEKQSFENVSS
ncbi:MAG: RHS repeat domain-containing protein, partial [Bacteriovoracia bacterium]